MKKKLTDQELLNTQNGIIVKVLPSILKDLPECSKDLKEIQVIPYYDEKSFRNNKKIFPAAYFTEDETFVVTIANDKVISISTLNKSSKEFKKFASQNKTVK